MLSFRHQKIIDIKVIISGMILLGWTFLIFMFSNQNGPESSEASSEVLHYILHVLTSAGLIEACDYSPSQMKTLEGSLRIAAHFFEYAVLGSLACIFINESEKIPKITITGIKRVIFALTYILLISLSDEFCQYFVPGRSFQVADILIDTAGGSLGILLTAFIYKRRRKSVIK